MLSHSNAIRTGRTDRKKYTNQLVVALSQTLLKYMLFNYSPIMRKSQILFQITACNSLILKLASHKLYLISTFDSKNQGKYDCILFSRATISGFWLVAF